MSFRKRASAPKSDACLQSNTEDASFPLPPGVRPSATSGPPITSWGLRSIDTALGGGLPLGTMTIVLEDIPTSYHLPLCSYVSAQGIQAGHSIAVASFDRPAEQIISNLPACVARKGGGVSGPGMGYQQKGGTQMKIAWRYQKNADPTAHIVSGDTAYSFAYDFDLSERADIPNNIAISCLGRGVSASLDELLDQLHQHLDKSAKRNLLSRIIIHGLSLANAGMSERPQEEITHFLCRVRALTRYFGAVAVVSCAEDVPYRTALVSSDATLKIDSFGGQGAGVAGLGKEWLGVLIVKKSFREGRAPCLRGKGDVWVFKRGRRKYAMERATAAPDEEEIGKPLRDTEAGLRKGVKTNEDNITRRNSMCGSTPDNSHIEF